MRPTGPREQHTESQPTSNVPRQRSPVQTRTERRRGDEEDRENVEQKQQDPSLALEGLLDPAAALDLQVFWQSISGPSDLLHPSILVGVAVRSRLMTARLRVMAATMTSLPA